MPRRAASRTAPGLHPQHFYVAERQAGYSFAFIMGGVLWVAATSRACSAAREGPDAGSPTGAAHCRRWTRGTTAVPAAAANIVPCTVTAPARCGGRAGQAAAGWQRRCHRASGATDQRRQRRADIAGAWAEGSQLHAGSCIARTAQSTNVPGSLTCASPCTGSRSALGVCAGGAHAHAHCACHTHSHHHALSDCQSQPSSARAHLLPWRAHLRPASPGSGKAGKRGGQSLHCSLERTRAPAQ